MFFDWSLFAASKPLFGGSKLSFGLSKLLFGLSKLLFGAGKRYNPKDLREYNPALFS